MKTIIKTVLYPTEMRFIRNAFLTMREEIYNNTYYQMPGVKFTNLIDSSVELRNNKKSQSKLTVSKLLGHEREDVTDIYLASFKKSDENIF